MKESDRLKWAQFRFGVIAPLIPASLEKAERHLLLKELLARPHLTPDGVETFVAERTIRTWLSKYNLYGFSGLENQARCDKGSSHAISNEILDAAEKLRREIPERSINDIICQLAETFPVGEISPSTLNYHLNLRGAKREFLSPDRGAFQRFQKEFCNQLWQADTSGGLWIPDPKFPGRYKEIRLVAMIDDASRVCTHAEFYLDERLPSLVDCFRKALLTRGLPEKIYSDNGKIFRSTGFNLMCAKLGIELSHSEKYRPEGRGKIERHFGTIKHGFFKEARHAKLKNIEEANNFLRAWLSERYQNSVHKALNQSPLQRWKIDEEKGLLVQVTPEKIEHALLLIEERRVNSRTACISLNNRTYQAGRDLAGKTVEIRWNPCEDVHSVEIWKDGKLIEIAMELAARSDIDFSKRPDRQQENSHTYIPSAREYLESLASRHQHEKPLISSAYLSQQGFFDLFATVLDRKLEEEDLNLLTQEFARLHPLQMDEARAVLEQTASVKGKDLHLGNYCQRIYEKIKLQRS